MKNWIHFRLVFGLLLLMLSCTPAEKKEASENKVVTLAPDDFKSTLASKPDAVLVDVRTPDEFSEGIIENAINIDFKDPSFGEKINALDKSKPYFVYCLSGKRSGDAAIQMDSAGFKSIYLLKGGYKEWKNAGLETVRP
jgi:rhodanese-related sulfurtransferase